MARFPDSRISAARLSSQARPSDISDVSLAAYSGGSVWELRALRVAAGVSVRLSNRPTFVGRGEYNTLGTNGLPQA